MKIPIGILICIMSKNKRCYKINSWIRANCLGNLNEVLHKKQKTAN